MTSNPVGNSGTARYIPSAMGDAEEPPVEGKSEDLGVEVPEAGPVAVAPEAEAPEVSTDPNPFHLSSLPFELLIRIQKYLKEPIDSKALATASKLHRGTDDPFLAALG